MRYIVIFLLLVNLGYFGWSYYEPAPVLPDRETSRPLLNDGLMLLSEYEVVAAEQDRLNEEAARVCSQVSGFLGVDDANSFIVSARNSGLLALLNLTGNSLEPQYRVYLPPLSSREIATITLDGLSETIDNSELEIETYLITRGLLENAIALGVFADQANAQAVLEQVSQLGYEPEIDEIPRSDGDIEVWLRSPDSERIEDAEWLDLTAERPDLTRAENLCQTIAQASQFP